MTDWAAAGGATWIVTHVDETGSTNADLVAQAALGAPDHTVLVADVQRAGRGRLGRSWVAPPGTALLFSVLLRPRAVPPQRLGWIGAILGMAICTAIETATGLKADLKWPNDVLIGGRKVAGILAELGSDALVIGAGINVTLDAADLPRPDATSLQLAGAAAYSCDRAALLGAVLGNLDGLLARWEAAEGDIDRSGLRAEYLARSATVGRRVTVHLPDGRTVTGIATDIATTGAIVVDADGRPQSFTAGDVQHLRTSS
ncbi:MAG: biotin--[acetyl-CoA-carboxylase] ligase [Actinobacteria bacterium 69-20]|nr:biotin--[acetyl-CoA-carboxylase] ligase [Actinomycetota bacterium]OJV23985.1 MAG: biotin--[acetyl-CoA-carboxylase] ligase [Actinobacteria bacterium 69-20]